MNKFLIIALIGITLTVAQVTTTAPITCHPSCVCAAGSNVCLSCVDAHSTVDTNTLNGQANPRSCPCNAGYYKSSLSPYVCSQAISPSGSVPAAMEACRLAIGLNTKDVKVQTNCYFEQVASKSYVVSDVSLNLAPITMSDDCKNAYVTKIQYKQFPATTFTDLPDKYITSGAQGAKTLKWPLIELYDLSGVSSVNANNQISQTIPLQIQIGSAAKFVRNHAWDLTVYTNRDQVQVFQVDVNIQETSGCQPGQDCIVIADLDTAAKVCTDASCDTKFVTPVYAVGDIFYANIWFVDSTYTKKLTFDSLYFKNDQAQVFDFTSITLNSWTSNSLMIQLPLVEPTIGAQIQVNMKINPISRMRNLADAPQSTSTQFTATVLSKPNTSGTTSAMTILFGFINLLALTLLF